MAYLILYWGSMCLYGLIFSYIFEGLLFLLEAYYYNNMNINKSLAISFIIVILLLL